MEQLQKPHILKINDTFASYEELREAVDHYENANRVQFWKRDAKRMERASPRVYEIIKDYPQLQYCNIRFSCIHGGQAFRPKNILGIRQRKSRGTWKQDCKAEILVTLSEDKTKLMVKKLVEEHNHEIPSLEAFKQFPKRRGLDRNKFKNSEGQSKAGSKLPKYAENILLENIVKANSLARSNNLKKIANVLREKYDCTVDLQSDENEKVHGFFFQDQQMKKLFELFPEILLIDGTYKLLNIGCCIYVLSVENSLGTTDVVGVGVLTVEDVDSADWMLKKFVEGNPKWFDTAIVVTDRLTSEYRIVPTYFPAARTLICLSHALQTFKKDTLPSKLLNVTPAESDSSLDFFNRLSHTNSEEDYHTILEDMEDSISYPLMQYFYKNWYDLKSQWVKGLGANIRSFLNSKFDSPNSKLKLTIGACKTFSRFIDNLFQVLYTKRNELKSELSKVITKVAHYDEQNTVERAYCEHLTPYACAKIAKLDGKDCTFKPEEFHVVCETEDSAFVVSEISCSCDFFTVMKLPCRHVLLYLQFQGLDLFHEYLFSERWSKKYLQVAFEEIFEAQTPKDRGSEIVVTGKTDEEKFEEAQNVCLTLAVLCSEVPTSKFEERLDVLMKLQQCWQNDDVVTVETSTDCTDEVSDVVKTDHDYVATEASETQWGMEVDDETSRESDCNAERLTIECVP